MWKGVLSRPVVDVVNDFLYSYQGKSRDSTRLKAIIVKEEFKKLQLVHAKFYGARETRLLRSYRKTVNSLKTYRR